MINSATRQIYTITFSLILLDSFGFLIKFPVFGDFCRSQAGPYYLRVRGECLESERGVSEGFSTSDKETSAFL